MTSRSSTSSGGLRAHLEHRMQAVEEAATSLEEVMTTLPSQLLQGITCSTQQALERMAEGTQHALGFLAEGLLVRIRRLEHLTLPPPAMPDVIVAHLACQGYLPQAGQLLCAGLRTGRLPTDE